MPPFPVNLDFGTVASVEIDMQPQQSRSMFTALQTVFIDNAANATAFTLAFSPIGPNLTVPKNSQGYFPLALVSPVRFTGSTSIAVGLVVRLLFYNFPIRQDSWPAA
jgi:hypothetical protein